MPAQVVSAASRSISSSTARADIGGDRVQLRAPESITITRRARRWAMVEKPVADLAMELQSARLRNDRARARRRARAARALQPGSTGQSSTMVRSGVTPVAGQPVEFAEQLQIEAAAITLVGDSGVRVAIGDHDLAASQRRFELLAHVLGAIGQHQQQLRRRH